MGYNAQDTKTRGAFCDPKLEKDTTPDHSLPSN